MKLCASNMAWAPALDDRAAEILRQAGASGVELCPTTYLKDPERALPHEVVAIRRAWEARGLRVVSVQALLHGVPEASLIGDEHEVRRSWERVGVMLRIAGELGASVAILGAPRARRLGAMSLETAHRRLALQLARAAELAQRSGTRLCLEPGARADGCELVNTTSEARALVDELSLPGFALHLDTASASLAGEDAEDVARDHAAGSAHVHLSRPGLAPLEENADVDVPRWCRALQRHGYERHVSIEMRRSSGDELSALRASLASLDGLSFT